LPEAEVDANNEERNHASEHTLPLIDVPFSANGLWFLAWRLKLLRDEPDTSKQI
jgi:hypothetical protein